MASLTRRATIAGLLGCLPGCATVSALSGSAPAVPTFELVPVAGRPGGKRALTLLVAVPDAPAAVAIDRILVKPDPLSVAYLQDARWSDAVPALLQSLVIRSIAATGRIAHVGAMEGGPIPDVALLLRIDAFQAEPLIDAPEVPVRIAVGASLIRDRDQRLLASRDFTGKAVAASDAPAAIVGAFQSAAAALLPPLADWSVRNASA